MFCSQVAAVVVLSATAGCERAEIAHARSAAAGSETALVPGEFSYEPYAAALMAHVDDQGGVDYHGLKAKSSDLDVFLGTLTSLKPEVYESWPDEGKVAFWINAYNSLTLKAIIDHYPIKASLAKSLLYPKNSIRQISGVWDDLEFTVMGHPITLNAVEHEKLRGGFDEPRIHAALVCAARSCPPLRNEPYTGEALAAQLDDQMKSFVSPARFRIDRATKTVHLSKILSWFGKDFLTRYGTDKGFQGYDDVERAVLNALSRYASEGDRAFLAEGQYKIKYLDYDWTLNEQKGSNR